MNDAETRPSHPFGCTLEDDLNILTNGADTGWWDDNGRPAPWPADFLDPEAGWSNGNTDAPADDGDENEPGNRPF